MFSIICPVHNKENELKETIDSVFDQEVQDFQLILVENASTDNSMEVIQSYSDERIHVIRAGKIGPGAARNLGADHAIFPWIVFLDADDVWKRNHLSNFKRAITSHPDRFFFSTSWEIWTKASSLPTPISNVFPKDEEFLKLPEVLALSIKNLPPFWTSAIAVSKEAFLTVGGFPAALPAHGEDVALWVKLLHSQQGIHFINNASAKYRIDGTNMTSNSFFQGQIYQVSFPGHIYQAIEKVLTETIDPNLARLWKKFGNKYQYSALSKALISGTFKSEYLNYLFPETDLKPTLVKFLFRNSSLRNIFKSYLLKNDRFHG
ncbi:glycosyltransferase family 2 protein [Algoriphagus litoralis]|uniref:glycosyltransferase family 2 protein n=1 Tax=Algoriphagus litoralis TaxID=2202829 RepID=UPI000DB92ABE|nr:glycosyltransferase family 2 protein [Algoriphagus litoralis]